MRPTALALWAGLALGCGARAAPMSLTPAIVVQHDRRASDCESFRERLPADLGQGFVDVPEDPRAPDGPHVEVFYYGRWDRPDLVGVLPILILNGGPASSSHDYFDTMFDQLEARRLPFVFMDQRGTGCSTPYPPWSRPSAGRYPHYSSTEIVEDAEAVRGAIGVSRWRAFGHSFGARIALRYVANRPGSLERVIISGDSFGTTGMETVRSVQASIEAERAALAAFLDAWPVARGTLAWLREHIPADRCYTDPARLIRACGFDLLAPLVHGLDSDQFADLATAVERFRDGDQLDLAYLDEFVRTQAWEYVDPATVIVTARDYTMFVDHRSICSLVAERIAAASGAAARSELFDSCALRRVLDRLPADLTSAPAILGLAEIEAGLRANPALVVTQLAGGRDALTSQRPSHPSDARRVLAADLGSRWRTVAIEDMTHSGVLDRDELWDLLASP